VYLPTKPTLTISYIYATHRQKSQVLLTWGRQVSNTWDFWQWAAYMQQNRFLDKTNTQKTVAKVKKLCTEEKPSFAYFCICVRANKITA
jgi:hypothetical protein